MGELSNDSLMGMSSQSSNVSSMEKLDINEKPEGPAVLVDERACMMGKLSEKKKTSYTKIRGKKSDSFFILHYQSLRISSRFNS